MPVFMYFLSGILVSTVLLVCVYASNFVSPTRFELLEGKEYEVFFPMAISLGYSSNLMWPSQSLKWSSQRFICFIHQHMNIVIF